MTTCQARPERTDPATVRCLVCRLAWDVTDHDPPLCPRTQIAQRGAQERLPFVSALAPDPFAGGAR